MATNRIIQYPQRLFKKLRTIAGPLVFDSLLARNQPGKIVMFHIGRSGSTVLADLLRQCPEVLWDKEIYERGRLFKKLEKNGTAIGTQNLSVDPVQFLRQRMARADKKIYGFEVKFYHLRLLDLKLEDYIQRLDNMGFCKFIILERKN